MLKSTADVRKMFFSLRISNLWNKLPSNIVNADTLNSFKNHLENLFGEKKYSVCKEEIFFNSLDLYNNIIFLRIYDEYGVAFPRTDYFSDIH